MANLHLCLSSESKIRSELALVWVNRLEPSKEVATDGKHARRFSYRAKVNIPSLNIGYLLGRRLPRNDLEEMVGNLT